MAGRRHVRRLAWVVAGSTLLTVSVLSGSAQSPSARETFMRAHYAEAIVLHDAVARGDLEAARAQAALLAAHRPDVAFPTGAQAFFGLMGIEAGQVRRAESPVAMARATASLLSRCGQCHQAMHVRVAVPLAPDPGVGGVVGAMQRHHQAADLLLEGLIGPSSSAWERGARELADLRVDPADLPSRALRERARIAQARLSALAAEAGRATQPPERAQAYGRLLAVCARCHADRPAVWGPKR